MLSKLINKLTKKQRIISLILFVLVVIFFILIWFTLVKKPSYKVTFYPENGTRSITVRVNADTSMKLPAQPFLDGYEFQYWSEDGINEFDVTQKIKENHKLYAVYLKICKITFISDNEEYYSENVLQGNLVKTPVPPEKPNYSFDYWDCNGEKYDFSKPVEKDETLLAKFVTRIPCTSLEITETPIYVGTEESIFPNLIIKPDNCTDLPSFKIDDTYIATVNDDHSIIGINPGQTRITVKCGDKLTESVLICAEPIDYIVLADNQFTINVGESIDVQASVEPSEASVYRLTYKVEDANVAFINEKGVVTGRNGGTTKITVSSSNGRSVSAVVNVNGSKLEMTGLPSSFYTTYSPADRNKFPVKLLYTEWKNGVKSVNSSCEGALIQCSIDAIEYSNGYIYQNKPVDYTVSSEIFFTYMASKSNSCYVICEPVLGIKDTENVTVVDASTCKVNSYDLAVEITMNCAGEWSVLSSSDDIKFSQDPVSCSFVPDYEEVQLRFTSTGGQILDINVS